MSEAAYVVRSVTRPEDLVGRRVRVVRADEEEIELELEDGRRVVVWAEYSCVYDDCSGPEDPWVFIDVKEVTEA